MKKIFLMLLGIAATINVMAVDYTAKAKVRVSSTTGFYCDLMLSESAEYGALTGSPIYLSGYKVALYVINGSSPLQIARAASLNDVPLALKTDDGTDYTFTVSSVAGDETLYLMDALGENHALTEGASFTIYDLPANSTIENRFTLGRPSAPVYDAQVTTNEEGWASFAHSVDVVPLDNSLKIYTGDVNGDVLTLSEVGYVKASEGVIVKGAANTTYQFMQGAAAGDFSANDLIGCPEATSVLSGTNFVLSYKNGATAFYEYTGSEIPAHKAYLNFAPALPAPKHIRMVINGTTAVDNVEAESVKAEKFVESGQIYIRRGNEVYNLQGQIVK